ncbi:DUF3426 domain-containing protein [Ramlibacter sp.]|uniref:DUF3426 domain-containing protein n=1 Tax=Ramlibacter sp. TaxID=1917967 RepID=UPI002D315C61|nr:DUF3426 domain-containing protein [Ramlibacter sp.]HYD74897.1 DUF3426 domain-containing protein [Ramlibacter sp.]
MSMITACPACGTMFRVVPDQLRISEGWVRCGHCGEVFDATGSLQPDPRPAEASVQAIHPRFSEPGEPHAHPASGSDRATEVAPPQQEVHQEAADASEPVGNLPGDPEPQPQPQAMPLPPQPTERTPSAAFADDAEPATGASEVPRDSQPAASSSPYDYAQAFREKDDTDLPDDDDEADSEIPDSALEDVSFVRQARRQAFWRRPLVRLALLLVVLALAGLLVLQFAVRERDRLAATQPQLRPLLVQLCDRLGCAIGAPRQIEAIVIDNSGFTRVRPEVYRLSFTLKNPSPLPVAVPALQLTLTDTQEQPVVQRVILPAELGAAPATIAAASDWSASVALAVDADNGTAARIAGYRLLAFYP